MDGWIKRQYDTYVPFITISLPNGWFINVPISLVRVLASTVGKKANPIRNQTNIIHKRRCNEALYGSIFGISLSLYPYDSDGSWGNAFETFLLERIYRTNTASLFFWP